MSILFFFYNVRTSQWWWWWWWNKRIIVSWTGHDLKMDNRRRKKSAFFWSIITHIVHMLYKIELQKKEYTKTSFHYGLTMNSTVVWYPIRLHRCFFSSFLIISNGVKQWMKMEKEKKKKEKHSNLRITTTTKQKSNELFLSCPNV